MYRKFKLLNTDASLAQVQANMPATVKELYPNLPEIYDATEMETQKSKDPVAQRLMWSNYKQRHTVKVQTGCDPAGSITSISDAYGGSTSDKHLFVKSGLADKLQNGEAIMVDKGYLIKDVLQGKQVTLLRPPFLKGGQQLEEQDRDQCRTIARHRIVVENVNARVKRFKILSQKIPVTLLPLINETVYVCGMLCHFSKPLKS